MVNETSARNSVKCCRSLVAAIVACVLVAACIAVLAPAQKALAAPTGRDVSASLTTSSSKVTAYSGYKQILLMAKNGNGVFASQRSREDGRYWKSYIRYALCNIDKKGKPELLVRVGSYDMNRCWHVFRYASGTVESLGVIPNGVLVSTKGGMCVWNQRQGAKWIERVKINSSTSSVSVSQVVYDTREAKGFPKAKKYLKKHKAKKLALSKAGSYSLLKRRL